MLIKENLLFQKVKEQSTNFAPILLFGPNEGLVRENFLKIKKIFNKSSPEEITFTGKFINEKPEMLIDEINAISMFHDRKIIVIFLS